MVVGSGLGVPLDPRSAPDNPPPVVGDGLLIAPTFFLLIGPGSYLLIGS